MMLEPNFFDILTSARQEAQVGAAAIPLSSQNAPLDLEDFKPSKEILLWLDKSQSFQCASAM